ncbi:MAG TPA: transglutaminase family protein [Thermoplasmata archaeon]|nr:transglutaminase family protein [Thermoplasmata archaeon]
MLREFREKGYIIPWKMLRVTMGAMPPLFKTLIKHPIYIARSNREARKNPVENTPPPYKIPEYREGMRYCKSNERYLRPTHLCNPHAKEIIAMANELGAYEEEPWDFANNVFRFVKENIKLAFVGLDREIDTLRRGSGTCIHQLSLFAALCRAGGLKARYKLYSLALVEPLYQNMVEVSPIMKDWYDALGAFMLHGTAEVNVDGEWVTADPTFTPEYEIAMGIPLAKLGDDPLGMWNYPVEGTTMILEGLPYGVGIAWNFLVNFLASGERVKIDRSLERAREEGCRIIREKGLEEYDRNKRDKYKAKIPKITLEKCPNLVFK